MAKRKKKRTQNNPRTVATGETPFKGVSIRAQIRRNRKLIYLGVYPTAEAAAQAYDDAAVRMHGANAITNASLGLLEVPTE